MHVPTDRLLTIEVLCHGIGSVRFFDDYIRNKERRYRSKAVGCSFRGKRRPGKIQQMVVEFENGSVYESPSVRYDGFYAAYLDNYILRSSCFSCKFACRERYADLSIGDNWGYSDGGGSLLIVNSEKGEDLREKISSAKMREIYYPLDRIQPMTAPVRKPDDYETFWEMYRENGFDSALKFLGIGMPMGKLYASAYRLHIVEIIHAVRNVMKKVGRPKE